MTVPYLKSTTDQKVPDLQSKHDDPFYEDLGMFQDEIPIAYILAELHALGPSYFNDKFTADVELWVEGINNPFWVHREFLVFQSSFFEEIFGKINNGDLVKIKVPAPETFSFIFEVLYDGNLEKFYECLTIENYWSVWKNVEYLGLGNDLRTVCFDYYQNEVCENFGLPI
ncbi:hypothetical protein G9A89_010065 [Geosiphon pyriformis]|nr:hypothetical protein G9A89_010065 [Geosiphon pyriformis]